VKNKDTILLDFQTSPTTLGIIKIEDEVYDDNSKLYTTKTTSGKTTLQYESYMLANILTIALNDIQYSIGSFDGAADMPLYGLTFNYCHEKNIEYLSLFVTKPLRLTTSSNLFNKGNVSFKNASKNEKMITILPGSTLILMLNK
jgi:hypothetical protein